MTIPQCEPILTKNPHIRTLHVLNDPSDKAAISGVDCKDIGLQLLDPLIGFCPDQRRHDCNDLHTVAIGSRGYREEMGWDVIGRKCSQLVFTISERGVLESVDDENKETSSIIAPCWLRWAIVPALLDKTQARF